MTRRGKNKVDSDSAKRLVAGAFGLSLAAANPAFAHSSSWAGGSLPAHIGPAHGPVHATAPWANLSNLQSAHSNLAVARSVPMSFAPVTNGGLPLDLQSTIANITLGSRLFHGASSVSVRVGDSQVNFHPGQKVTAAEYVAVTEASSKAAQTLVLDSSGAAIGGSFRLDTLWRDRLSALVIPANVIALDNVSSRSTLSVRGDFLNYGSLYAYSSNPHATTAIIKANDIVNEAGGVIATNQPSSLTGVVSASLTNIDLSLTAGNAISNSGLLAGSGNVNLLVGNGSLINTGTISSARGNINITSAMPHVGLKICATGGTFLANNGAINLAGGNQPSGGDIALSSGNYLSKALNLYAGQGTITGAVAMVTGTLNSQAAVEHFKANSPTLILGANSTTGDPTFINDGNIVISGVNTFSEDVSIIANGNITATAGGRIEAKEHNVILLAGVDPGTGSPSTGTVQTNAKGIAGTTTVDFSSPTNKGGNIDFSSGADSLVIDTSGINGNGGNITLAAFANGSSGGSVLVGGNGTLLTYTSIPNSTSGFGGNVTVIAGAAPAAPAETVHLGSITTTGGFNAPGGSAGAGGAISIYTAQPKADSGTTLTFNTDGTIAGGGSIVPSSTINPYAQVTVEGKLTTGLPAGSSTYGVAGGAVTIHAGGDIKTGIIQSNGSNGSTYSGPGLAIGTKGGSGGDIHLTSDTGAISISGDLTATGGNGGNGGNSNGIVFAGGAGGRGANINISAANSVNLGQLFDSGGKGGDGADGSGFPFAQNGGNGGAGGGSGNISIVSGNGGITQSTLLISHSSAAGGAGGKGGNASTPASMSGGNGGRGGDGGDGGSVTIDGGAGNVSIDSHIDATGGAGGIGGRGGDGAQTGAVTVAAGGNGGDGGAGGSGGAITTSGATQGKMSVFYSYGGLGGSGGAGGDGVSGSVSSAGGSGGNGGASGDAASISSHFSNLPDTVIAMGWDHGGTGGQGGAGATAGLNGSIGAGSVGGDITAIGAGSIEGVSGRNVTISAPTGSNGSITLAWDVAVSETLTLNPDGTGSVNQSHGSILAEQVTVAGGAGASFSLGNLNTAAIGLTVATNGPVDINATCDVVMTGVSSTGSANKLAISTSKAVIVSDGAVIQQTGALVFNTSDFQVSATGKVEADSITVYAQSLPYTALTVQNSGLISALGPGGILITTYSEPEHYLSIGGGGTLQATSGTIQLSDLQITFAGDQQFHGKTVLSVPVPDGYVQVNDGVTVTGDSSVVIAGTQFYEVGTGKLTGNPLIFSAPGGGGVIAASGTLDISKLGPLVFHGSNLAFIAGGSIIDAGSNVTIDLSNDSGGGGSLAIIAGVSFTPGVSGVNYPPLDSANPYTIAGFTAGDISLGHTTIVTSGSVYSGSVQAVASGSIALGAITASGPDVTNITLVNVIGNGVTFNGAVTTTGNVSISSAVPAIVGAPVVSGGIVGGGKFVAGTAQGQLSLAGINASVPSDNFSSGSTVNLSGGTIVSSSPLVAYRVNLATAGGNIGSADDRLTVTVKYLNINAGTAGDVFVTSTGDFALADMNTANSFDFLVENGGNMRVTNYFPVLQQQMTLGISAHSFTVQTGGEFLTSIDTIVLTPDANGDGGSFSVDAHEIGWAGAGALTIDASGTGLGNGGSVSISASQEKFLGGLGGSIHNIQLGTKSNDLNISANSGPLGGNGGKVSISSGFDLGIDDAVPSTRPLGSEGDGGILNLSGGLYSNSSIAFNENGVGHGNGGTINIQSFALPELKANGQFTFSATSGALGGNGGTVALSAVTDITIDPAIISANPSGPNGDGAHISLVVRNTLPAGVFSGGDLLVLGNLTADGKGTGKGGQIVLQTVDDPFNIGSTSVSNNNGVRGTLSVAGAGGSISISNMYGGIVNSKPLNKVEQLTEVASGKGNIVLGSFLTANTGLKTVSLTVDKGTISQSGVFKSAKVELTSLGGDIGSAVRPFNVNTAEVTVTAKGVVNVLDSIKTTAQLDASTAGSTFKFVGGGAIATAGNITAGTGVILTAGGANHGVNIGGDVSLTGSGAVSINATGSGGVLQTAGTIAADTVSLKSVSGALGVATPLAVDTDILNLTTSGATNIQNVGTSTLTANGSGSRSTFKLSSAGDIVIAKTISLASTVDLSTKSGSNGSIFINANTGGGTTLSITVVADGSGDISTGKNIQLHAKTGGAVSLLSGSGNFTGVTSNALAVYASNISANTGGTGTVNLNSKLAQTITLADSSAGGNFNLTSAGTAKINDVKSGSGSVLLLAKSGAILTASGADIQSGDGSITIEAASKGNGAIELGAGTTISTFSTKTGGGQVILSIGAPSLIAAGTLPANVQVNNISGGSVFFGKGITASAPLSTINLKGSDVTFNVASRPITAIKLDGGVTITADPVVVGSPGAALPAMLQEVVQGRLVEPVAQATLRSPELSTASRQPDLSAVSVAALSPATSARPISVSAGLVSAGVCDIAALLSAQQPFKRIEPGWISETELSSGEVPGSIYGAAEIGVLQSKSCLDLSETCFEADNVPPPSSLRGAAYNPAATKLQQGQILAGGISRSVSMKRSVSLNEGAVLFAPSEEMIVNTRVGSIHLAAGSVVFVVGYSKGAAIYNLHDCRKGDVTVGDDAKGQLLSPGMFALLTQNRGTFEFLNPAQLIPVRNVRLKSADSACQTIVGEFDLARALGVIGPLKNLSQARHPQAAAVFRRVLKTASIMNQLGGGGYEITLRPQAVSYLH